LTATSLRFTSIRISSSIFPHGVNVFADSVANEMAVITGSNEDASNDMDQHLNAAIFHTHEITSPVKVSKTDWRKIR
jgi:hypothetical protein